MCFSLPNNRTGGVSAEPKVLSPEAIKAIDDNLSCFVIDLGTSVCRTELWKYQLLPAPW